MRIIVVDNASRDGSADMVAHDFPTVNLVRSDLNLGFAAANNVAFRSIQSPYTIILNPDAIIDADSLTRSLAFMKAHQQAGLLGGRLLDSDGSPQPSARNFPSLKNDLLTLMGFSAGLAQPKRNASADHVRMHPSDAMTVDWVPGAFCMIRTQALRAVNGFDERFFLYFEEVDLCRRLWEKNWQVWYDPAIRIEHIGGASASSVDAEKKAHLGGQLMSWYMRSALLYYRKHHGYRAALGSALIDIVWHRLRAFKTRLRLSSLDDVALKKRTESETLQRLMRQAWRETSGGQRSPPTPW
jgi:GT2 family glycosyltransferase